MGQWTGVPPGPLPPAPSIRADLIDYETLDYASFVRDAEPIDAQVVEALWRVRGSGAAVTATGARFLDISKLTTSAPGRIEAEARFVLQRLVKRGDIRIKKTTVDTGSDWAEVVVDYINVRAHGNKVRQARVRLPEAVNNG